MNNTKEINLQFTSIENKQIQKDVEFSIKENLEKTLEEENFKQTKKYFKSLEQSSQDTREELFRLLNNFQK